MPRSPDRISEDERRAARASPRVGDVAHQRCGQCGMSLVTTFVRTGNIIAIRERWLCRTCTQTYQRLGHLVESDA